MMSIEQAFSKHAAELAEALTPDRRRDVVVRWRQTIDANAPDYADLVAGYDKREDIIRIEAQLISQAFLCGYLAGRGWLETEVAQQAAFMIGRALRDEVRASGIALEQLNLTVGAVIDDAMTDLVQMGIEQGEADAAV